MIFVIRWLKLIEKLRYFSLDHYNFLRYYTLLYCHQTEDLEDEHHRSMEKFKYGTPHLLIMRVAKTSHCSKNIQNVNSNFYISILQRQKYFSYFYSIRVKIFSFLWKESKGQKLYFTVAQCFQMVLQYLRRFLQWDDINFLHLIENAPLFGLR